MRLKSAAEIDAIGRAGDIVAGVLALVGERAAPGVSTEDLDAVAESYIRDHDGAAPAFKGLYGFPAALCTSLNDEVVHGIPSPERRLVDGDLLGVDVGVVLDEMYADAAVTLPVGQPSEEVEQLLDVTRRALEAGVSQASSGSRLGDVGAAIQDVVEDAGFSVIRELVGHGVGFSPHEEPHVPNFGRWGEGLALEEGLVIAIEPMINAGTKRIVTDRDEWTILTADRSLSAHFEHTVVILDDGPEILTRS